MEVCIRRCHEDQAIDLALPPVTSVSDAWFSFPRHCEVVRCENEPAYLLLEKQSLSSGFPVVLGPCDYRPP